MTLSVVAQGLGHVQSRDHSQTETLGVPRHDGEGCVTAEHRGPGSKELVLALLRGLVRES